MKIGYPCLNRTLECKNNKTFRLANYSKARLFEAIANNLDCLQKILQFNVEHHLLFLRLTSDLVPLASHPICTANWQERFRLEFGRLGEFIQSNQMRISMHPGQYTLLNSPNGSVFQNSVRELLYHADVLDLMGLDESAKIQVHVGGIYGDKAASLQRFIDNFTMLDHKIRRRLVIENDERLYSLRDCLRIHTATGVPVLFDVFHHSIYNHGETIGEGLQMSAGTWRAADGIPLIDYSSQKTGGRPGSHAETIDSDDFRSFLTASQPYDFDLMLEIKDKEKSALQALEALSHDSRLI